jgi:tetratricopeptide (TPR) repeat protein
MDLGAINERLGNVSRALDYYQQSHSLYESLGNELGAAQNQADVGAILIEYAGKREEGLRDVRNSLEVFRKLGDKKFEAFGLKVIAAAYRYAGQHAEAEQELNRALALTKERNVDRDIAALTIDLARSKLELSDYVAAESLLTQAVGNGSGKDTPQARIHLALAYVRLGKFDAAQTALTQALVDVRARGHAGQLPQLYEAMGELALESGRARDARAHFQESAALWTDDLPDPASVEGKAYVGLLDGLEGQPGRGRIAVQSSLEQAGKMGLLSLEARCRVHMARIYVSERRFDEALSAVNAVSTDVEKAIGRELQAQLHYWRSRALAGGGGDRTRSDSERGIARQLMEDLRGSLPELYRDAFTLRPDVHLLIG